MTGWRGPTVARATLSFGVLLLICTACGQSAARTNDSGSAGGALPLTRGPLCGPEPEPATLPAADAVVDSARFVSAVAGLAGADQAREGHVLLSLEFDEVGVMMDRDVLEHSTSRAMADDVWRLVREMGRDPGESERQWGVRLRVEVADPVALEVGHREFCRPVSRNPQMHAAMQQYRRPGVRVRRGEREETVHVRVLVSDLGTVTDATIVRGALSGGSLERELFQFLQQFLFYPATIDGAPADAWVEIPVHVRMRS